MLRAIIFDFDGVIVNTEPLHYAALAEVLQSQGLSLSESEYYRHYISLNDRACFRLAMGNLDEPTLAALVEQKNRIFTAMLTTPAARKKLFIEGAMDLIQQAGRKYPLAICSAALRKEIEFILDRQTRRFTVIISADDVRESKPDPAGYRLALQRLNQIHGGNHRPIGPEQVVVIEDTPGGIDAAHAAGMKVLAVATTHKPDQLTAAELVKPSPASIAMRDLQTLCE